MKTNTQLTLAFGLAMSLQIPAMAGQEVAPAATEPSNSGDW
jgi:invasion protein IalB